MRHKGSSETTRGKCLGREWREREVDQRDSHLHDGQMKWSDVKQLERERYCFCSLSLFCYFSYPVLLLLVASRFLASPCYLFSWHNKVTAHKRAWKCVKSQWESYYKRERERESLYPTHQYRDNVSTHFFCLTHQYLGPELRRNKVVQLSLP